jgi:uncharacterized protein (TIGR02266 family)
MTDQERRDKRYPSQQELSVRCEDWGEFAELYAADVSRGGMFILTERPMPLLSEVDVSLRLPEGHEMQLKATVVHVVSAEQAVLENKRAGVGVQFVGLDAVRKQQIKQLTEFARESSEQGSLASATYASRLFETAPSLPPSKVLDALPPAPGVPLPRPSLRGAQRAGAQVPPQTTERPAARRTGEHMPPARRTGEHSLPPVSHPPDDRRAARRTGEHSLPPERAARRTGEQLVPPASSMPPGLSAGIDATGEQPTARTAEEGEQPAPQVPVTPADPTKLKVAMTHFAHRRWEDAIKAFEALVAETGGDPQARHWLHMSRARLHLKNNDEAAAAEHYAKALETDESNHEARKFVREHSAKKRLAALPFGRYFVKKS